MATADALDAPPPFGDLNRRTQAGLREIAEHVGSASPRQSESWSISPQEMETPDQDDGPLARIKRWARRDGKFLYVIEIDVCIDPHTIVEAFNDTQQRMKDEGRKRSRLNVSHSGKKWLYVGRSEKLHVRLKEHLGHGSKSTYSLQLLHWAKSLGLRLKFHCVEYGSETPDQVLQSLEDRLWDDLLPMFGRRGPR